MSSSPSKRTCDRRASRPPSAAHWRAKAPGAAWRRSRSSASKALAPASLAKPPGGSGALAWSRVQLAKQLEDVSGGLGGGGTRSASSRNGRSRRTLARQSASSSTSPSEASSAIGFFIARFVQPRWAPSNACALRRVASMLRAALGSAGLLLSSGGFAHFGASFCQHSWSNVFVRLIIDVNSALVRA